MQKAAVDMDTAVQGGPTYTADEAHFVEALRAGDELAFVALIDRYQPGMLRLARVFVRDVSVAEEVVQEAWLAVLRGLHRFEARSSLKWWISSILVNGAKTRATRERRSIPFSAVWDPGADPSDPSVEPERFRPDDAPQWPGGWVSFPRSWSDGPDDRLLLQETQSQVRACIDAPPANQRAVIELRDVHGFTAQDTCTVLQNPAVNQRVLLHRAALKSAARWSCTLPARERDAMTHSN